MKKNLLEDNPEALAATNEPALALHIKDKNIELNMEVATEAGEIY